MSFDNWTAEDLERELAAKKQPKGRGRPQKPAPAKEPDPVEEPEHVPFPIDCLPGPLQAFVREGADVLVAPPSYIALPCLSTLAACIGTTRRVVVKSEFVEPATLWTAVIGNTGSRKTAGYKLAMSHLIRRQQQWHDAFEEEFAEWELGEQVANESGQGGSHKPAPVERQIWTADTTVDALTDLMAKTGQAVLTARAELAGWLNNLSRYTSATERADWLEFYDGGTHVVNRRKDKKARYITAASCSITGGIQPEILLRNLTPEHIAAGLYGRFMPGWEPEPPPEFHLRELHPDTKSAWGHLCDMLLALEPGRSDAGETQPIHYKFGADALAVYGPWFVHWQTKRAATKNLGLQAARAKYLGQAARLALVLHTAEMCWRAYQGTAHQIETISAETVQRAMSLCEWFDLQNLKVYGEEAVNVGLLSRLQQIGKPVTARDLTTAKVFATTDEATAALNELEEARKGEWSKEGKKKVFSLFEF